MLESVHSESPIIHTLSGSSLGGQLRSVDRTKRVASTAPFTSERGVVMRCSGVGRVLLLAKIVYTDPSLRIHSLK